MKYVLALCVMLISLPTLAKPLLSGYYLKWDSDHTERQIRPVYPINDADIKNFKTYKVTIENGKPTSVCYFLFSNPSNDSNFGAHCIQFSYNQQNITRTFYNVNNVQVTNREDVHQVQYIFDGNRFSSVKRHLNKKGELINNASGIAEFHFKRDKQGRRISEIRKDSQGIAVPEHNGFYEARFAFDKNDYATYRKGFDQEGLIMEGPHGYATAYFWFDGNGTFLKEEFRNAKEELVLGPSGSYAKIDYGKIDKYGNWHNVSFFDENAQLLTKHGAFAVAHYDKFQQRQSIHYYDINLNPAENARGVAKYIYVYDAQKRFVKREGISLKEMNMSE